MTGFWSLFIIIITVVSVLGTLWLLLSNAKGKPTTEDTGHVWDGDLRELTNPLPRWWFNLFILTIVFTAIYLALFPGLGNFAGQLGWTSSEQMQTKLDAVLAKRASLFAQYAQQDPEQMVGNPAAMALGRDVYLINCAGCHGADARGAVGFPDLADQDWLYGGTPHAISVSIASGRNGMMPPMAAGMDAETLDALVKTVAHWGDSALDGAVREKGMAQYTISCAACHGMDGKGNPMMGAPNLTDAVWLYGGTHERVLASIEQGRRGAMPAHAKLLSADEIKVLTAYVYGLSK